MLLVSKRILILLQNPMRLIRKKIVRKVQRQLQKPYLCKAEPRKAAFTKGISNWLGENFIIFKTRFLEFI